MLTEAQEKYLSTLPNGQSVEIKPFDPKAQEVANTIIQDLKEILPNNEIHFGGASALGIAGQNDIDINILSVPEEYETLTPLIVKLYGEPNKKGSSIEWKFIKEGFEIELYLTNKNSQGLQEQIKVFEILSKDKDLYDEYEQTKLPYGTIDFKEYMRKKYAFFNKVLDY